ncbi:MAG: signal peptidase I [Bacilli bacterium]|nr:signal peptidase I [Bacilli bacterium]
MSNKKILYNYAFFLLFFLVILLTRFVVFSNYLKYSESIISVLLIILFIISIVFYGFKKPTDSLVKRKILKKVLSFTAIYFLLIYSIGLITGFLTNSYSLKINSIINNIFFQAIIIIMIELIRSNFINYNKKNIKNITILTALIVMFEINMVFKIEYLEDIKVIFKFITTSVLPITFSNIMRSYITYNSDFEASLIYSLIIGLYKYIVPIEPDLENIIISIINIILPFLIIMSVSKDKYNQEVTKENINSKKYISKSDIPLITLVIILLLLVFGIGPYKIIGIKSESMTPRINKGDAVVIDKNIKKEDIKVSDIVAYENDNKELIVHRIIKINKDGSYATKGDFNNTADGRYIKFKNIVGKVKFKIPYIAYPAVYFSR